MVDDIKAALLPDGPLAGGEGFLHVQLRPALGCFVCHGVGPGVGPPSHGALGHLDGGGAAAGREQRRDGQASGEAWEEKTLVFVDGEEDGKRGGGNEINANGEVEPLI